MEYILSIYIPNNNFNIGNKMDTDFDLKEILKLQAFGLPSHYYSLIENCKLQFPSLVNLLNKVQTNLTLYAGTSDVNLATLLENLNHDQISDIDISIVGKSMNRALFGAVISLENSKYCIIVNADWQIATPANLSDLIKLAIEPVCKAGLKDKLLINGMELSKLRIDNIIPNLMKMAEGSQIHYKHSNLKDLEEHNNHLAELFA